MGTYNGKCPSAHITMGNQRLKQHNLSMWGNEGSLYLEDKNEFEIELYNPLQERVMAEISINGNNIGPGLIIRPGERFYLDRFLNDNKKFVFSTYKVEDSDEVAIATQLNGVVEVKFYKEKYVYNVLDNLGGYRHPIWNERIYFNSPMRNFGSFDTTGGYVPLSNNVNTLGFFDMNVYSVSTNVANTNISNQEPKKRSFDTSLKKSLTETGRVEKGNESKQKFSEVNATFETIAISIYKWKLLPKSKKVITSDDIVLYCGECGSKKKKDTHRFCPHCGTKY